MGKKDKKLVALLEECQNLKDKKKYKESIRKYREVLNHIRTKIKDEIEQKQELDTIKSEIDLIYSLEIEDIIEQAVKLVEQKKFNNALEEFNKASASTYNITNTNLRERESNKIESLKRQTDVKILIEKGNELKEEKQFDDAVKVFNKALTGIKNAYDATLGEQVTSNIENYINLAYSEKIKVQLEPSTELKEKEHHDDAIEVLEKGLKITEQMYDSDFKSKEITKIKNQINEVFSDMINPILKNSTQLIEQHQVENAISELKKGIDIMNRMYDSEQKHIEMNNIGTILNPIYSDKAKPIIEEGKQLIDKENYEQSIQIINDAVKLFREAFEIVNKMVKSEQKKTELRVIEDLINKTSLAGIKPRKQKGLQLIEQKQFEDAIRELYSVISIAKNMIIPEEQENAELFEVKKLINKVYSAEITDIIEAGNSLVELKKYEEAIEIFNNALNITNKMYLSDEMDEEISKIKNSIYQTELKQIISKGNLSDKQEKFNAEIKRLSELLENAKIIKEADLKAQEMERIKREIDHVHAQEINLLIEQGTDLAIQTKFESAFDYFEKAITIVELIDSREIKEREMTNIIDVYKQELNSKAKQDLNNEQVDNAIELCKKAIELDVNHVESYFIIGNAYKTKKDYDKAILNYKKAVELETNHASAWNAMGLAQASKKEFDNAIESYTKAIRIDSKHANACYNMGNAYKHKKDDSSAIDSYKKAVDLDPNHAKAWLFMGSSYYDQKKYDHAIECIEKGIELNPELGKDINSTIVDFKKSKDLLHELLFDIFKINS